MFGIILPSRPVLGPAALQTISPTQFAYTFPAAPSFSHIVVFLLPENTLPPDVLAGIYIQFPHSEGDPNPSAFKLLGAVSADKQSAIFRVANPQPSSNVIGSVDGVAEVDMDAVEDSGPTAAPLGNVTVGISIEPIATLQPQLAALSQQRATAGAANGVSNGALIQRGEGATPSTKVLAQRIIRNAFNFLASFAGGDGKVPLKSFEEWWKKFERRIEADPGFLERDGD